MDVSVIIPVYRNAPQLAALYSRLCAALDGDGRRFELIFVDDGCPEGSRAVIEALALADARVAALGLTRNVGQHRAALAGLAYARGAWAVVMDADLQDPPEAIPALLARGRAGAAAVFAGRRGRYQSPRRLLTSLAFKLILALLTGVPPDAGMFVAIERALVTRLLAMGGERPSLVAMIGCSRAPSVSLPVTRAVRPSGQSAYSAWRRLRVGQAGIGWVLGWRWRMLVGAPPEPFVMPPIDDYIGRRFISMTEQQEMYR